MVAKTDPLKLNNAVQLYLSGKSAREACTTLGISTKTLYTELQVRGIEARTNRVTVDIEQLRHLYIEERLSELEVARRLSTTRIVVRRRLIEMGIKPRNSSQASRIRMERTSPEQRSQLTTAAHDAVRGRQRSTEALHTAALSRQGKFTNSMLTTGERQLRNYLGQFNIDMTPQVAVGPYNVDFALAPVAVEVLGGTWHEGKVRHRVRTPYILNQGWLLIFIWHCRGSRISPKAAEYVVATLKETRRDPSLVGQYRVIRGDGELLAVGSTESDSFTLVHPSIRGLGTRPGD